MQKKKTTLDILIEAKELIKDEKNWTQGELARTSNGSPVCAESSDAVCFCSLGAIDRVSNMYSDDAYDLISKASRALRGEEGDVQGVAEFNDSATHAEVLELFDAAIELAIKEGN